ncbi:transglycosylase domain-containing protein [Cellulomonas endophytica]|uniref:transglycosylase domain-containing protein n=1 Tax=Cellulomonas endophytica TaxID=2494735 RepID=UPI001012A2C2|nr:transglycosylase domain-containing protein [Cellulomonas endophytica]
MPQPPRARRQVTGFQALALLLSLVLVAGVGGLLTAGLLLPSVAAASTATEVTVTAFDDLPGELQETALPEKSTIRAADGTVLATFYSQNRVVVSLDQISPSLRDAVVAVEDRRFYEHNGVDPTGMGRALLRNLAGSGGQEGASTLTQQYVKNVLVEQALEQDTPEARAAALAAAREDEGDAGYARKLREAKLALTLEERLSKDQILERYLNIAQFGVSVYGAESAAQFYFSKPAAELTYLEAATIAGVTKSPTALDPVRNPDASQVRRNTVLSLMHRQGRITDEEFATGTATPLVDTLRVSQPKLGCMSAGDVIAGSGYFCDYVVKVIRNDPAFGETQDERVSLLYRGGLDITTTLVPGEQTAADTEVKAGVPVDDPSGIASALVVVEPGTGRITAMAQNRTYNNETGQTERETSVNYSTSYTYGGSTGFPPGSTFKPFTLLEWLKKGRNLSEVVNGSVRPLNENMFTACGSRFPNRSWTPGNAEGGAGNMTVLNATKNSVNLAYLTMATQLDLCDIMAGAADLGVVKAGGSEDNTGEFDAYPSTVLGSDSTTPLSMAGAFAAFASGGVYCTPIAITQVLDAAGEALPVPDAGCRQALEPRIANAMNYTLSNVWTGTASGVDRPSYTAAGKTGTTSENEHTWFVGFNPLRSAAVWVGYADNWQPMQGVRVNGRVVRNMYGSTIAAPTWVRFMDQAMAGLSVPPFAAPENDQVVGRRVSVPSVVGRSVGAATSALEAAGFRVRVASERVSSTLPDGAVAQQSARTSTTGATITLTLSNGQPPAPTTPPADPAPPAPDAGQGGGDGGGGQGEGQPGTEG